MIAAALARFLLADTGSNAVKVRTALATYAGGAAVFTRDPPGDSARPCLVIRQTGGAPWDTREDLGEESTAEVEVLGDKPAAETALRALAWLVWKALNRATIGPYLPEGKADVGCVADPPTRTPDDAGFPGYTVRVEVRAM